jgi:HEAT repeat protein
MHGQGPAQSVPQLIELQRALSSRDPALRKASLSRIQPGWGMDGGVIGALNDQVPEVRRAAARALGRLDGPGGIRALTRAASSDPSPEVRTEAIQALARILADRLDRAQPSRQGREPPPSSPPNS